MQLFYKKRKK